jgi:hypothetical protein
VPDYSGNNARHEEATDELDERPIVGPGDLDSNGIRQFNPDFRRFGTAHARATRERSCAGGRALFGIAQDVRVP